MEWIARHWLETIFAAITGALTLAYHNMRKAQKEERIKRDALRDGLCALLRDRIIQEYNLWKFDKGFCPIYAMESILAMHASYKALGGNGTIDNLISDIKELPAGKART